MLASSLTDAQRLARIPVEGRRASVRDEAEPPEVALFRRMYRTDFSASELAVIAEHLKAAHAGQACAAAG